MDLPKTFYFATVDAPADAPANAPAAQNDSVTLSVRVNENGSVRTDRYTLTATSHFMGGVEDKVAFAHLKPGMNVYIWTEGAEVKYASPIYR